MRKTLLTTVMTALLATGACAADKPTAVKAGQAAPKPPSVVSTLPTGCAWDNQEFDGIPMGINQLANISAAAITGQITAVSEPRWNSRDGSKWCPPLDGTVRPIVYRDVTVKVSDVTFTSEKLTPRPGDELVIRTFGDGTPTGPEAVTFDKDHVLHENNVDGEYEVGKEAFLFVSVWDRFPTENGTEVINQVTGSWGGNFEIDRSKDLAKSVEPGRTVPYRALIARAQKERELGRKPERDPASRKNPLGE